MKLNVGAFAMRIRTGENAELRRRHGQRATAAECIIEAHQAAPKQRVVGLVEGAHAVDLVNRALLQVILQISPDALSVEDTRDPKRRQPIGWPNAGAMQHLRRADRAGAQHYFALGAGLDDFAASDEAHTGGASVLDEEAVDQHVLFEA